MSNIALNWVSGPYVASKRLSVVNRSVLHVLADHADAHGMSYPSVPLIVEEMGASERAVRYALVALEKGGLIERAGVTRRRRVVIWRVLAPGLGHGPGQPSGEPKGASARPVPPFGVPCNPCTPKVQPLHPIPPSQGAKVAPPTEPPQIPTPTEPPRGGAAGAAERRAVGTRDERLEEGLATFRRHWPGKQSYGDESLRDALRKAMSATGGRFAPILDGLMRRKADILAARHNPAGDFSTTPMRWLRERQWERGADADSPPPRDARKGNPAVSATTRLLVEGFEKAVRGGAPPGRAYLRFIDAIERDGHAQAIIFRRHPELAPGHAERRRFEGEGRGECGPRCAGISGSRKLQDAFRALHSLMRRLSRRNRSPAVLQADERPRSRPTGLAEPPLVEHRPSRARASGRGDAAVVAPRRRVERTLAQVGSVAAAEQPGDLARPTGDAVQKVTDQRSSAMPCQIGLGDRAAAPRRPSRDAASR